MGLFNKLFGREEPTVEKTALVPEVGRLPYPAYRGSEPYVFVSYAHIDHELVFAEIARFNEAGFHVWYDEGISPGNEWTKEIAQALLNCSLFVVMVTPNSIGRRNVQNEINFALTKNLPFIAIHLRETTLPPDMELQIGVMQAILKYNMTDDEYAYKYINAFQRLGLVRGEAVSPEPSSMAVQEMRSMQAATIPVPVESTMSTQAVAAPSDQMPSQPQVQSLPQTQVVPSTQGNRIVSVNAGGGYIVAVRADGNVACARWNAPWGESDISDWSDIASVALGDGFSVGLKVDGRVLSAGRSSCGQRNVYGWRGIVAISAGEEHTVGLKADGTVVAVGDNSDGQCDVSGWSGIIAISAGGAPVGSHTLGLKSDGTALATGYNDDGQCNVSEWRGLIAVSAGARHSVGLRSDGTVVATGYNTDGQCDVSAWSDIIAISAGRFHTVGLKSDGTVLAVGDARDMATDVSWWTDVVSISAGDAVTAALLVDGSVVATYHDSTEVEKEIASW